ncbi:hypothetical protein HAP94_10815 [Acidithiobacillus ferrivorans]|nr:hypothetical protein [Acidithiobacillus ferrivorans]
MATVVAILTIHFMLMSKDFRTFVVLGTFSFAGSLGKQLGILLGQAVIYLFRGIKIAFHFHSDTISTVIKAIHEEAQMIDHGLHPDDNPP